MVAGCQCWIISFNGCGISFAADAVLRSNVVSMQKRLRSPLVMLERLNRFIMSKWVLILGVSYSGLLLYIYVILPSIK